MPKSCRLVFAVTALIFCGCAGQGDPARIADEERGTVENKPTEELDPSLYAYVLQEELKQVQRVLEARESTSSGMGGGPLPRDTPDCIFLAVPDPGQDGSWVVPPDSLIKKIGRESVRSARELTGNDPIYLLTHVQWVDSHSVVLDKEQIQAGSHHAMRKMKLSKEDGAWRVIDPGEYWESNTEEDNPFQSYSNSGQPTP